MAKTNLLARRPDSLSECAGWTADIDRARAIVADRIAETVDKKWRTAVAAERETGLSQTEFSRIRHGKLERYTVDRLVQLLHVLDEDVEVRLDLRIR